MITQATARAVTEEEATSIINTPEQFGEPVQLGPVVCDFMSHGDFVRLAATWLEGSGWHHVVTLNPEMVMLAERDEVFREVVGRATVRVPDGAGLVWARWYLRSEWWPLLPSLIAFLWQRVERVTGVDTIVDLARLCAERDLGVYLVGGRKEAMERTAAMLRERFPSLRLVVGPVSALEAPDSAAVVTDIQQHKPAVLLAAWGAPAQTLWLDRWGKQLESVHIAAGVGGAFDMLGEMVRRAPRPFRALNLEWLWRLYLQPKRARRIWQAVVAFPLLIRRQRNS